MTDQAKETKKEEEARRRFEHLAGGLLQVDPDELEDEASKTDPSDADSGHDEEE